MTSPLASADPDPRPQPPERPLPSDCCDSGCPVCVHDLYAEEVIAHRQALAAWLQRHPTADATASR
ncbi:MAG: oxidoreductase-like domain-containing protein [Thermomonas sp.]